MTPIVLDFDASVGFLKNERRINLQEWQERLRFSCTMNDLWALRRYLGDDVCPACGPFFLGSGDFHHVSLPLIAKRDGVMDVVILDNHPDNMRFPWGVHCGSWVRRVAALPGVRRVHVVGIHSQDIAWAHFWENYWWPLYRGRVHYWAIQVPVKYATWLGLGQVFHGFAEMESLIHALLTTVGSDTPLYLSIDKDVLSAEAVRTNWDQGLMQLEHLYYLLHQWRDRLVACDVTGDVSMYHYQRFFKHQLSRFDGQDTGQINTENLHIWQAAQHQVNERICHILADI